MSHDIELPRYHPISGYQMIKMENKTKHNYINKNKKKTINYVDEK